MKKENNYENQKIGDGKVINNKLKVRAVKTFPSLHDIKSPPLPDEKFFYRPYLSDEQTIAILDILYRLKPNKCFEYGAGYSTVFFSKYINNVKWISVEHLQCFIDFIKKDIGDNVLLIHQNLPNKEVKELSENKYSNEILNHLSDGLFDFIFVDGEHRPECIKTAFSALNKGGILILHDWPYPEPIMYNGEDLRSIFEEHGCENSFWWGRK